MEKRFVSIWFPYLCTDWFTLKKEGLYGKPFVVAAPDHGRMVIKHTNTLAESHGIFQGMAVADARALLPSLTVLDEIPGVSEKLLTAIATWCIRYSPVTAIDPPSGILLDVTGCCHLWKGEENYLNAIFKSLKGLRYDISVAMADTIGCAWGTARFGKNNTVVPKGGQVAVLESLPPAALRITAEQDLQLKKLGLTRIHHFLHLPRPALRRRFGIDFMHRLDEALGNREEFITPLHLPVSYEERLPCIEPLTTNEGIVIALQQLLDQLCTRLEKDQKGIREITFTGYRTDGKTSSIRINTYKPSHRSKHLFELFEHRIPRLEPGPGFDVFLLQAGKIDQMIPWQDEIWEGSATHDNVVSELLDRIANRTKNVQILRYQPAEHHWPERSFHAFTEEATGSMHLHWSKDIVRPLYLLEHPEVIEVTAPVPDYPPMMFRYKNQRHKVLRADGPERIEQEWWLQQGQQRDYYIVEDEDGRRFWLFRAGHYSDTSYQWFIHGYFS